jgi:putative phosphoribosyl transferase
MFASRKEAGRILAAEVARLNLQDPLVLALPRGGVPVAYEVAKELKARLDLVLVRKVGAPGNAELAVAAIVDGDPPDVVLNREIVEAYGLQDDELARLIALERPELERRREVFRGKRPPLSVSGKTVVIVDDGAATGTTMKVAIRAIRRRSPMQIVVALPVASEEAASEISREVDKLVCLNRPARFRALGYFYKDFHQLDDNEVVHLMARSRAPAGA